MADTTKRLSEYDADQIIQKTFNKEDASLTTNGFLVGKIGHRVTRTDISPTVEQYSFYDGLVLLYTLEITYDNSDHDNLVEAERIA